MQYISAIHSARSILFSAFIAASPAVSQTYNETPFSDWNDGGQYSDFVDLVTEHEEQMRTFLGRIPLSHADFIFYFESSSGSEEHLRFFELYGPTQMSSNCYAFAVNDPEGHRPGASPTPGKASGIILTQPGDGDEVARLAILDGLLPLSFQEDVPPGHYRVALVIATDQDFHWYREHTDGTWYHKMGHAQVNNQDASGEIITNPETANRDYTHAGLGNYSTFYGYFAVPLGGIDLNTEASQHAVIELPQQIVPYSFH